MGDNYTQAVSSALNKMKPNIVNMSGNRISSKGIESLTN